MDCHFINENIIDYLEHQLNDSDKMAFDAHLNSCKTCSRLVADVGQTYQLAKPPKDLKISPDFVESTLRRVNKKETRIVPLLYQALKPIAVAASIGLGILIGNGEMSILNSNSYSEDETLYLSTTTSSDYSVWQTLEEDYGSED
jgi:predicted anti-sigma-YlaC factor YlaD